MKTKKAKSKKLKSNHSSAKSSWRSWFADEPASADFLTERKQPNEQQR
jgi:hypothetical protein